MSTLKYRICLALPAVFVLLYTCYPVSNISLPHLHVWTQAIFFTCFSWLLFSLHITDFLCTYLVMSLPTPYARSHKFSYNFCHFIQLSTQHQSSISKPPIASAASPCHLMPRLTQPHVRSSVRTTSDRWIDHSMEHTWRCNVSRSLPRLCRHSLSIVSNPAVHMLI
jgi:hypothetical protein